MGRVRYSGPIESVRGFSKQRAIEFWDDFIGAYTTIAAPWPATPVGLPWAQRITGAAPPTVAAVADAVGGRAALSLTATNEAQQAGLDHANQRNFLVTNGGVMEAIIIPATLPTGVSKLFVGLGSDNNADINATTHLIGMSILTTTLLVEMDDSNTDINTVIPGVTIAVNDVIWIRIDFSDILDIKYQFAINPLITGRPVAYNTALQGTKIGFAATGANATLQPVINASKTVGTTVGVLHADYYYVRTNR